MQKIFHTLCILTCICLSNPIHGMKRNQSHKEIAQTNQIQTPLPDDLMPFIAAYSQPKMKNMLMKVCKAFNTCLKNKALIIGINPFTVRLKDKITCMFECACSGNHTLMDILLNIAHMRPDHTNSLGMTPLHYAMERNHRNIVLLLIKHGADALTSKPEIYPLHDAAYKGDKEYIMSLLALQPYLNPTLDNGNTPLSIAILEGHTEIEQLLRNAGAEEGRKKDMDDIMLRPINANSFAALLQRNKSNWF